jgi:hypothetical protein
MVQHLLGLCQLIHKFEKVRYYLMRDVEYGEKTM